jgi:site-specific recombinase XerD
MPLGSYYSRSEKASYRQDEYRIAPLLEQFGNSGAESISPQDTERWLDQQAKRREWSTATKNRYIALLKLIYRLAERDRKIKVNPARLLRIRKENNGRIRYLNQFAASNTEVDYLKCCTDEESRLKTVIEMRHLEHVLEFEIALQTGMRPSEQYGVTWDRVDLARQHVTIPKSKNGKVRHVRLNSAAVAAFKILQQRSTRAVGPVFVNTHGEPLRGYKHWFDPAVKEAGLKEFTWYLPSTHVCEPPGDGWGGPSNAGGTDGT